MAEATVIAPGDGELLGDSHERRVEILAEHDALHATWSRYGPHRAGAALHVHRRHSDFFYVLDGELTVALGPDGDETVVPAGTLARVPPLVVHGFRNASDAEVSYLNLHAPGQGFADFMRGLRDGRAVAWDQEDPPDDGGRPPAEAAVGAEEVLIDQPALRAALLADVEEIALTEASSDPGGPAPPAHVHDHHQEAFYVIEGELTLIAGGRELRVDAGSWAQIPPGTPHTFAFSGTQPVRFLDMHTPNCGFGTYLRALLGGGDVAGANAAFDQRPA